MKISTTLARLPLILAALAVTPAFAAVSPFGLNFTQSTGNPTSGTYDGVLFSDWTGLSANINNTNVGSHATTTFALPQSGTANKLTGWYAAGDYWNPGAGGSPNAIFGSTLGSNISGNTGLAGHHSIIQFSNVGAWLADNGYTSLSVTVYYSGYGTNAVNATLATTGAAKLYGGTITSGNTATFTSTQTLLGTASGTMLGGGANAYCGSATVSSVTGDFLIAAPDISGATGGIAAIKIEGFTAVPEPSTYGLIGAGALAAVAAVRRRRRSGKVA